MNNNNEVQLVKIFMQKKTDDKGNIQGVEVGSSVFKKYISETTLKKVKKLTTEIAELMVKDIEVSMMKEALKDSGLSKMMKEFADALEDDEKMEDVLNRVREKINK